ncbi:MAG: NAD-dependent epimerase/dehydratase family protein, partial [Chthoniobacterales bacterium]
MKLLLTGVCGFVGSSLARALLAQRAGLEISGLDNFIRPGSETNREELRRLGVKLFHGDVRVASDLEALPPVDSARDESEKRHRQQTAQRELSLRHTRFYLPTSCSVSLQQHPHRRRRMKLLLTGACGFVGSSLARAILAHRSGLEIFGVDNFI